ncbi:MAG: NAD(P)-dependent oxidoreductase [Steroidobacter sp.]
MATVAFMGLGRMGSGMAARLLAAGHRLRIYNRTPSRADALVKGGASVHATPRDACAGVDAVISMVADDAASRSLWLGADGVFAAQRPADTLVIECSTLSYEWVMELSAEAQRHQLRYIDSPVTGLPDMAANGELTMLVGADPEHLRAVQPILSAFSKQTIHFGAIGAGTAYKLIINLLGAIQIASVAEGMAIAERAGLNLQTVADAIATGQAASPQVVRNARRMVAGDHDRNVSFTPELRLKDVRYALDLAAKLGLGAPFGAVAGDAYEQLCRLGFAQQNESKIIEVARAQSITSPRSADRE